MSSEKERGEDKLNEKARKVTQHNTYPLVLLKEDIAHMCAPTQPQTLFSNYKPFAYLKPCAANSTTELVNPAEHSLRILFIYWWK